MAGDIRPTSRPDLDNYVKAALDAINGIVIADDALVVELEACKRYGPDPKVVLTVTPLAALPANGRRGEPLQ
jgi:Holliday junction resolvase RusA-like endonuclease